MNHKVLLADDSLTIQKVIKITLANQPYDITEVSSEEELFHQLPLIQPKLVFLDFNLSEKYTGYELTQKIKSLSPTTKVLLLLGTFDSVDDAALEKSGASEKIVKPFDSNKFIAICRQLIDTFADEEELSYPEEITSHEESAEDETAEDQWEMSHSTEQSFPEPIADQVEEKTLPEIHNPLLKEVSDWGMSVPGVIDEKNADDGLVDLPPVIGEVASLQEHRAQKSEAPKDENKYPSNDDLDYPTIEELEEQSAKSSEGSSAAPKSKLISIESFSLPEGEDEEEELKLESFEHSEESDVKSIEDQIRDEVEENLWQADEFEDIKQEVSSKIEEVKSNFQPSRNDFDDSLFKPIDDSESISWEESASEEKTEVGPQSEFFTSQGNVDQLRSEMEAMVKKYVKEYLDDMFKQSSEKVAWEVIPDLAENLIRQELSKISNKVLND